MDVGQSPIQFIDHIGSNSRPAHSYYYSGSGMNNVANQLPPTSSLGALSSRLHQLRPAGSVPFSSRTNPNQISSTIPRQKLNNTVNENEISNYQTLPITNKSISTQNLSSLNNQPFLYRDRGLVDNQILERPRPSSARDPGFTDIIDLPVSQQRRFYDSLYAPRLSQPNQQKMNSTRFRQQRSSSFDYERELALLDPSRTMIQVPQPIPGPNMFGPYDYHYAGANPIVDNLMMDYQTDIFSLQRDMAKVQQELELTKEKLASSLNSIKTFWSPELKRERAMRKDENSKYVLLAEELHQLHMEKKNMLSNIHQMDTELRKEKELRSKHSQTAQEVELLYRRCEELEKENRVFCKQSEEYEKRALSQKESLVTAEENIRKLLEVVKVAKTGSSNLQGLRLDRFEEDQNEIERLRSEIHEYSQKTVDIEKTMVEKDFEISRNKERNDMLNQEVQNLRQENEHIRQDIQQTQTLQSLVDTKESKILTLENEIRLLEDELARLRDEELITPTTVNGVDDYDKTIRGAPIRPHDRLMKSKLEAMSCEISKRDSEIYSLQSRLEMAEKQYQDQNHHINVLKEQVKTREHKISMLLADVEDFRKRLKEKEVILEKKSQILTNSQSEKHQIDSEILDLKDQCEMKDKKISLLQRKVENLEDILNDKENQLTTAKSKLITLHSEHTTTEGTKVGLEECLRDRDRQLERLKESKTRMEHEFQDELEMQKKSNSEIKSRFENSERELREKVAMLNELREEVSELKAIKFKRESEVNTLQVQFSQKSSEVAALQLEIQTVKKQYISDTEYKTNHRISEMESQLIHYSESTSRLQGEVDRLLTMMRGLESEKIDKDRIITQLEGQIKDSQNTINNMKRTHQNEKNYLIEDMDALKRKEDNILVDMEVTKTTLAERENRIKELEQALRESVKVTAERENYFVSKEDSYKHLENKVSDLKQDLEQIQKERNTVTAQLLSVQDELRDREMKLKTLENECFQNYIPELDRMRKSNQDLILRVQALLKLVQGREFHLSEHEKISLTELGIYPDSIGHRGYPSTGRISAGPYSGGLNNYNKVTWSMGSYPISHTSALIGGSVPHIHSPTGGPTMLGMHGSSAFHSALTQSDEVSKLSRLLHEKEQILRQQMDDVSRLRLQNLELESKLKTIEERITGSSYYTSKLGGMSELTSLRQTNTELTNKVNYMKSLLEEREETIKTMSLDNRSNILQTEIDRIKRELGQTIIEKDSHITVLASDLEKLRSEKADMNNNFLTMQHDVKEKHDKIRTLESEQGKLTMDKESLQKKYQTALNHLQEKTEKIENLERECYQKQQDEIKRLKLENEENNHRLSFFQKSLSDRDIRIEQLEKEHYKLRDELTTMQKLNHNSDTEVKRLKEELGYREQRLKQIQSTQIEELNQARLATQEANSRLSQMRMTMDEKDQLVKSKSSEIDKWKNELDSTKRRLRESEIEMTRFTSDMAEKDLKFKTLERAYNDEIQRFEKANEESNTLINLMQKRIDEREARQRKIEQDNNELLDEIHSLRKRNHELESNLDLVKQQIIDSKVVLDPASRSSSVMDLGYYTQASNTSNSLVEMDKIRRQYQEALNTNNQLQREVDESSLQCDRLTLDRDYLNQQLIELEEKHEELKRTLLYKENELSSKALEMSSLKNEESDKLIKETQELREEKRDLLQEIELKDSQISEIAHENDNFKRQLMESEKVIERFNIQNCEMEKYIEQVIKERDDERSTASSNTATVNTNYQRQLQQQTEKFNSELEIIQKENNDLKNRIQDLTRHLQDTQKNIETITKERDLLREHIQDRSKENQIIQLSKELERVHRAEETSSQQLKDAQKNFNDFKNQTELMRQEFQKKLEFYQDERDKALSEVEELQLILREHQEEIERRENEMLNSQHDESEKLRNQCSVLSRKLQALQQESENKDRQLNSQHDEREKLKNQCSMLSKSLQTLQQEYENRDQQLNSQHDESDKLRNQCSALSKTLQILQQEYDSRERQTEQLAETLEQSNQKNCEQQKIIGDLQKQCQQMEYDFANCKIELEKIRVEKNDIETWANQMKDALNNKGQELANLQQTRRKSLERQQSNMQKHISDLTEQLELKEKQLSEVNRQLDSASHEVQELKCVIQELSRKLESIQNSPQYQNSQNRTSLTNQADFDKLQDELNITRKQLQEKDQRVKLLETECFQQQADEIERLRKELKIVSNQESRKSSMSQQSVSPSYSSNDMQSLKLEVDSLKRELNLKIDQLEKFERECQEKHLRRIEAMQLKIKRYEEDLQQYEKQNEELKRVLEDREKKLKQVKMSQHQATSVELEKLREEFNRSQDEVSVRTNQIKTLEKQINSQIKEILEIKQEALTASLCEKDANIALLQMTGANNSHAQQAMQKLMNEKSQMQSQLKQLSTTRQKLQEEQNK